MAIVRPHLPWAPLMIMWRAEVLVGKLSRRRLLCGCIGRRLDHGLYFRRRRRCPSSKVRIC